MWWPSSWEQSVDDLARYDWIGWSPDENEETLTLLKEKNPNQLHFTAITLTETSFTDWEYNPDVYNQIPAEWFLTQRGSNLSEDINTTQTTIKVTNIIDEANKLLFEEGDTVACEYESMKVSSVDVKNKTITVERGFYRKASSHKAGTRIAPHITFWYGSWVMNISTFCPKVNGKNWVDWALQNILPRNARDGYLVDRIEEGQSWLIGEFPRSIRSIDPDSSNKKVSDYSDFDKKWVEGIQYFIQWLRNKTKIVFGNTLGAYNKFLNGCVYEGYPYGWGEKPVNFEDWFVYIVSDERGYVKSSKSGYFPNFSLIEEYEVSGMPEPASDGSFDNPFKKNGFVPNYQKMRFALTTALLGDGYFSYEINTNGHGSLGLMWFDEYDNAGKGRGYLGSPVGEATMIKDLGEDGKVYRRDFENGIVICNPANVFAKINLGKPYRLIKGKQAKDINTGELVKELTILPRDGRILLKE